MNSKVTSNPLKFYDSMSGEATRWEFNGFFWDEKVSQFQICCKAVGDPLVFWLFFFFCFCLFGTLVCIIYISKPLPLHLRSHLPSMAVVSPESCSSSKAGRVSALSDVGVMIQCLGHSSHLNRVVIPR